MSEMSRNGTNVRNGGNGGGDNHPKPLERAAGQQLAQAFSRAAFAA